MSRRIGKAIASLSPLLPECSSVYSREAIRIHWIDILAMYGHKVDKYIAELAKRSIEKASPDWGAPHHVQAHAAYLNQNIHTGVWGTISTSIPGISLRQHRTEVLRAAYAVCRNLGCHYRFVVLSATESGGNAHVHFVAEFPWVVDRGLTEESIIDVFIEKLTYGKVYLAPFVFSGGAIEYQLGHTYGPKLRLSGPVEHLPRVMCPGHGPACSAAKCNVAWEDPMFQDGSRYNRSRLPRVVVGEVARGKIVTKLPRTGDKKIIRKIQMLRAENQLAIVAENELRMDANLPSINIPESADEIIRARRRELKKSKSKETPVVESDQRDRPVWLTPWDFDVETEAAARYLGDSAAIEVGNDGTLAAKERTDAPGIARVVPEVQTRSRHCADVAAAGDASRAPAKRVANR